MTLLYMYMYILYYYPTCRIGYDTLVHVHVHVHFILLSYMKDWI